jgi:hypothetical protein
LATLDSAAVGGNGSGGSSSTGLEQH